MANNYAFTICTKSYVGLATVLKNSLLKFNKDYNFYIFVVDDRDNDSYGDNVFFVNELGIFEDKLWLQLAFKYNVTEFCTCLKPFVCKWIFDNTDAEKVFYMDPDLYFFSDSQLLINSLDDKLIELTPHFVTFPENSFSKHFEDEVRYTGMFNLGFLGIKRHDKVIKMLNWWGNNLLDKCYAAPYAYQFTDQKWMDFVPIFFDTDEICVLKNLGCNIAPWNYFERKVYIQDGDFYVTDRNSNSSNEKIIFCHFSGFNYKEMLNGTIIQQNEGHDNEFADANLLINAYISVLGDNREAFTDFFDKQYTYNYFSNGQLIDRNIRVFYKSLLLNEYDGNVNPFDCSSKFYSQLKRNKLLISPDKTIERQKENKNYVSSRLRKISPIFKFFYKLLGMKRYFILMRFLRRFSRFENQIFLLNKDYISWL